MKRKICTLVDLTAIAAIAMMVGSTVVNGQDVKDYQKISSTQGGFTGTLDDSDLLGHGMANIGDLDGDGVTDLAVGAVFRTFAR